MVMPLPPLTPTEEHAGAVWREVGPLAPAVACSAPRSRAAAPRRARGCAEGAAARCPVAWAPTRRLLVELVWDSTEAIAERSLDAAARLATPYPVARPVATRRYVGRRQVEPAPLLQVGVVGDLAAALAEVPDRRSRISRAQGGGSR